MLPSDEMLKKYNRLFDSVSENYWEDLVEEIESKEVRVTNHELITSFVFENSLKGQKFWYTAYLQRLKGGRDGE